MKGIQDTSSSTLRQLLGNGLTYEIPKFQRDYSWQNEQWDDLWQDIQAIILGEESAHYMGYLVLQTQNDKNYKVIDGQQRMITLSILVLSAIKALQTLVDNNIDADNNQRRIASLRNTYIGYLNPVTLVSVNKLKLNKNNDSFYRQKLVPLETFPKRGLNISEKLMRNCFNWFDEKVRQQYLTGEALAAFIDTLVDKLFFTVITVDDELNAFRVFETLNARGVQLSSADLLKNYLFSLIDSDHPHITETNEIEVLWNQIIGKLGNARLPEFLRIFWNSRNKTVRKRDLFKAIRRNITTKAQSFQLLRDLNTNADTFIALRNPNDEMWQDRPQVVVHLMALKLFQVKQPFALLLTAFETLSPNRFVQVLKACAVVSFRYNIIGSLNPNDQERVYNNVALHLREHKRFDLRMLADVYPDDARFQADFSNKVFKRNARNHKMVKYIFSKIERQLYQTDIDISSDLYTVEHILPEAPEEDWEYISENELERCVYRLGNLTILERRLNQDSGVKSYEKKAEIYQESSLNITKSIPEYYTEWTEATINTRQSILANKAKTIWQIAFD